MSKAKEGIWTPWAEVLCYECHGPKFPRQTYDTNTEEWKELTRPKEQDTCCSITQCDRCGEAVQLQDPTAVEHSLAKELRKLGINANMWQTGGMCSAVGINAKGDWTEEQREEGVPHYLITFDMDGRNEYWLGTYDHEGCPLDPDSIGGLSFETTDRAELIEHIKTIQHKMEEIKNG